jgi:hypothetical protein
VTGECAHEAWEENGPDDWQCADCGELLPDAHPDVEPGALALAGDQGAVTDALRRGAARRHPSAVTIERLDNHMDVWADQLTPKELSAFTLVMRALAAIERGER